MFPLLVAEANPEILVSQNDGLANWLEIRCSSL